MLNFRFHIVSLVAVFLALAIGIIMGSTVIDRALVDTLEDQQQSLRADLDDITGENASLHQELGDLREAGDRLASEGGERLLSGALADVPVLVVAVRGADSGVLDDLRDLLATAGAADQGTLWLTDRLALGDDEAMADLAGVLGVGEGMTAAELRATAVEEVAGAMREAVAAAPAGTGTSGSIGGGGDGASAATTTTTSERAAVEAGESIEVLLALRDAGFVEYDAPEGRPDDVADLAMPGTRVILVSGATAEVPDVQLALPLARALVSSGAGAGPAVDLLAAEGLAPADESGDEQQQQSALVALLRDDDVGDRLSTVDNLDSFAGRVAAVVAVVDLGAGRRGHYGVGPGAQRLVPAPAG